MECIFIVLKQYIFCILNLTSILHHSAFRWTYRSVIDTDIILHWFNQLQKPSLQIRPLYIIVNI